MLGNNLNVNTVVELDLKIVPGAYNNLIYIIDKYDYKTSEASYYVTYLMNKPDPTLLYNDLLSDARVCVDRLDEHSKFNVVKTYLPDDFYFYVNNWKNKYTIINCKVSTKSSSKLIETHVENCKLGNENGEYVGTLYPNTRTDTIKIAPSYKENKDNTKLPDIILPNIILDDIYNSLGE